jgi:hypothetical protein
MTTRPVEINVFRARTLRRDGMSWREIAETLSAEQCRSPRFQTGSVQRAVGQAFGTIKVQPETAP